MSALGTANRISRFFFTCGLLLAAAVGLGHVDAAAAATPTTRLSYDATDVRLTQIAGRTEVSMVGLLTAGGTDAPAMPMALRTFVVPAGYAVREARVTPRDEVRIAQGVHLATRAAVLDDPNQVTRAFPAGALEADAPSIPARAGLALGGGTAGGYTLQSVAVFPLRWDRATGDLFLARTVDVELALEPAAPSADLVRVRRNPAAERAFAQALSAVVENPGELARTDDWSDDAAGSGFAPRDVPSVQGSPVDMVIVTTPALAASFQTLADWKTKKGVPTVVKTTDWIDANYPAGHDQPERVRDFLKDAYSKWGTYLVLIGGDYTKVQPRLAFNHFFFQGGTLIPTDEYYACLDGNWNADGDAYYGEAQYSANPTAPTDSADIYPDVFLGRASVDTPAEVTTFVNKSLTYEKTPPAGYVQTVGYLAEVLFPQNWVYGDPPEQITLDGKTLAEQLDLQIPGNWTRFKHYQSENNEDRTIALAELTGHHHMVVLVNHGDAFKFSCGNGSNPLVYIADTDTLHNANYLSFVLATACNPNQIDLECQGESLMNNPNGGAVAVVGPTREDFPVSANAFHQEMLNVCFAGHDTQFGVMTQVERIPFAAAAQTDNTPDRWTLLTKMLLGDPDLRLWTREPGTLTVSHPASLALGTASVTVTVQDTGVPVPNALVCVRDTHGTYTRGLTNAAGSATLALSSTQTGTVDVTVTALDHKPKEDTFTLTAAAGAVVALQSSAYNDDAVPPSNGNGDGKLDAGETVELNLTARNGGTATANGVTVTASVGTGSNAVFDLLYKGVRDVSRVYVGPNRVHPATIPFTLDFANPLIEYIGTPSMAFAADTSSGDHGIFVWQDDEAWHVRWGGGADSIAVNGTVTTNGQVRGLRALDIEAPTDSAGIGGGGTTLTFVGSTHAADLYDGVDFDLADNTMLSIVNPSANLGNIAAGATANGTVVFSIASNARDGQLGYVDLLFNSTSLATWNAVVPVIFNGPSLEAIVSVVNDGNAPPVNGDGDGVIEVGETVRVTPTVLNRGTGQADGVVGTATAGAGITFIDSSDSYGSIPALGQTSGTNGYVFTVNNASGTSITLNLADSRGRHWIKTLDFVAPPAPTGVTFTSNSTDINIAWAADSATADLAGYRVYRSASSGGPFTVRSFELLRNGSTYVDGGLSLGSGFYYQVSSVDSSGNESAHSSTLFAYTTQPQAPGWPKLAGGNVFASLVMANGDGLGASELYAASQNFNLYAWEADGTPLANFPPLSGTSTNGQIWSTPTLADLNNDGNLEVLCGSDDGKYYVLKHDGTPYYANPWLFDTLGIGVRGTGTVTDIDHNGSLEIFVGSDLGALYAFNANGTGLTQPSGVFHQTANGSGQTGNPSIWGPCAVADLDGDGIKEIAFGCWNDSLFVCRANGTNYPGFPKKLPNDMRNGPVFADLDGDGKKELMVGCIDGKIYAYRWDGSNYLPGGVFATLPLDIRCQPTPCQLDGDRPLEVVVPCYDGHIYAFNADGTGFLHPNGRFATVDSTNSSGGFTASAIVCDVDGDGQMEIFVGHHDGKFYGFHANGTSIVGFPIPTSKEIFATACAADLDNDGKVEIAFASYDQTVNVLDFNGASTPAAYQWPMYGGNRFHTSVWGDALPATGVNPGQPAQLAFAMPQNEPNPFGTGTTIRYSLPKDGKVLLRIYNVGGQLVRTLIDEDVAAGAHAITWDGRDGQGARLSTGVYFYRLDAAGFGSLTRKALYLR
ncbi:MAG: C25 family cysteine peptidase [bacterium]